MRAKNLQLMYTASKSLIRRAGNVQKPAHSQMLYTSTANLTMDAPNQKTSLREKEEASQNFSKVQFKKFFKKMGSSQMWSSLKSSISQISNEH